MKYVNIAQEGIEQHIDTYFVDRNLPFRYADVIRLRDTKIGKRKPSLYQLSDELKVSRTTLYKWSKYLP